MLLSLVLVGQVLAADAIAEAPPTAKRDPVASRRDEHSCVVLEISSRQGPPRVEDFSATELLDLELRAFVRPMPPGPHLLELKVYTPRGHLYQVLPLAFEGWERRPAGDGAMPGWQASFREPLPVQRGPRVRVGGALRQRLIATLPVAGTSIVSTSLYGRWRVAAHLDGATTSCGRSASFRLVP